jgi:hypothetical protein
MYSIKEVAEITSLKEPFIRRVYTQIEHIFKNEISY